MPDNISIWGVFTAPPHSTTSFAYIFCVFLVFRTLLLFDTSIPVHFRFSSTRHRWVNDDVWTVKLGRSAIGRRKQCDELDRWPWYAVWAYPPNPSCSAPLKSSFSWLPAWTPAKFGLNTYVFKWYKAGRWKIIKSKIIYGDFIFEKENLQIYSSLQKSFNCSLSD